MLVRTDLPTPQIAVQAIHATIDAARQFLTPDCEHPHLVLCAVASEARLLAAADYLVHHNIRTCLFREPDRNGEATALATEPLCDERRRHLERFRCLTAYDLCVADSLRESFSVPNPFPERSTAML